MPRPDDVLLSAYLDGEIPDEFRPEVEAAIAADAELRDKVERLSKLQSSLHHDEAADLDERMDRSLASITRRISVRSGSGLRLWWQQIRIPVPAIAAAAAVFVALVGVLVWSLLPGPAATTPEYLAEGRDVDVTIRVEDAEMERVLDWLAERQLLGEISIQLPEQEFRIVGEPVLLKPDDYPEGFRE